MAASDILGLLFKIRADSSQAKGEIAGLRGLVNKEINKIGTDFASAVPGIGRFTSALGPVGLGLVATAGAALGAGVAVFGLAKSAATTGNELLALSTRTGVSVETLSSLRLVALQSNTSLEQLAVGINIFNRQIGQAAEGSKEATAALKRFGIEPKDALSDSEAALAKVFKRINELPPGIQRAVAAQQAFGKSGAGLVQVIQSVGGNLDEFMAKARKSSQVSLEGARAGDKLDSSLTALSFTIGEVTRELGQGLIPAVNDAATALTSFLTQNRENIQGFFGSLIAGARGASAVIRQLHADFMPLVNELRFNNPAQFGAGLAQRAGLGPASILPDVFGPGGKMRGGAAGMKAIGPRPATDVGEFFAPGGGGGKKGGGGKAAVVDSNQLEITRRETERFYKEQEEIVNRSYERQLKTVEEFTDEQVTLEERRAASMRTLLIEERAAITEKGEARKNKERTINEEIAALAQQSQRTIIQIRDKGAQEAEKIELTRRERDEQNAQAVDDRRIANIEIALDNRQITEAEAEKRITAIRIAAIDREVQDIKYLMSKVREGSAEHIKLQGEVSAAESRRVQIKEEGTRKIIEGYNRETQAALQAGIDQRNAEIISEEQDPSSVRSIFGPEFADAAAEGASNFEAFGDTLSAVLGNISASTGNVKTIMGDLFGSIAQGAAQGIKSFILLGNFGGAALRKFAAEAIASVAAQAAVKAIFELAEGYASLANFNFVSAAEHFAAAKFYGIIAGVAAVAGRAVAGSAFANDAKPAPVAAGSGGTNQPSRPEDRTIRESRSGSSQQVIIIRLESGLVGEKVRDEIANNGPLRGLILETAKG